VTKRRKEDRKKELERRGKEKKKKDIVGKMKCKKRLRSLRMGKEWG